MVKDLRPVVVSGLVRSGSARVVVDSTRVAVRTKDELLVWAHDGAGLQPEGQSKSRWRVEIPDADGHAGFLTVVKGGGCTCGKPWLKQGSAESLLEPVNV